MNGQRQLQVEQMKQAKALAYSVVDSLKQDLQDRILRALKDTDKSSLQVHRFTIFVDAAQKQLMKTLGHFQKTIRDDIERDIGFFFSGSHPGYRLVYVFEGQPKVNLTADFTLLADTLVHSIVMGICAFLSADADGSGASGPPTTTMSSTTKSKLAEMFSRVAGMTTHDLLIHMMVN
jgi:hypothetical protein